MTIDHLDESIEAYLDGVDDPALLAQLETAMAGDQVVRAEVRRDIGWDLAVRATLCEAGRHDRIAGIIAALPTAGPAMGGPAPRQPNLPWRPLVVLAAAAMLMASVGIIVQSEARVPAQGPTGPSIAVMPRASQGESNAAPSVIAVASAGPSTIVLP